MKKLLYILILMVNMASFAQSKPEITVSNYDKVIKTNSYFSVFFDLNQYNSELVQGKIQLPENWQVLIYKSTKSDSLSNRYFYTISFPKNEKAGSFPIKFEILENQKVLSDTTISVSIVENRKIEIVKYSQPEYALEGDTLTTEFLIQNLGNTTEKIILTTSRGRVMVENDTLVMLPNSSKQISVEQVIPITNQNGWDVSANLIGSLVNSKITVYQVITVPVYSNSTKKVDLYNRFPVEVGGMYLNFNLGGQTMAAYQYLATGSGYLDFSEKHHMDFTVRGPNKLNLPAVGSNDQYTLEYTYKKNSKVMLGDYINKVSNLLEYSRFGRGVKLEHTIGKSEFQIYFQKARFQPNQNESFGANYGYQFKNNINFNVNYFNKGVVLSHDIFRTNIVAISSKVFKQNFSVESELALGNAKSKWDIGGYNKLNYNYKKFNLNSEFISAGKNFHGFYNNSRLLINGLNYSISKKISVGVNSNFTRINPSLDINSFNSSPKSKSLMLFASYMPSSVQTIFLNFSQQEREDRQSPSTFHYKESFGNLSYSLNKPKFTVSAQGRFGKAQNLLAGDLPDPKQNYSFMVQPTVRLQKWLWVGGFFENQHTNKFSNDNIIENLYYYGGNVKVNVKEKINLNFMYRNNYAPDEFFEKRSFIDANLVFDFKKHQLSITGGRAYVPNPLLNSLAGNQNTLFFAVKYVLKLNVPTMKNKNIGHLKGQVLGLNQDSPMNGIILQMGPYKTMTDNNGNFNFTNIKPDHYHITMPSNTKLAGLTSKVKTPMPVTIGIDSTSLVKIEFVKTGGVIGKVNFDISDRIKVLQNDNSKNNVLLKLFNDKETFITQINDKNEFSFKDIKPGEYKLIATLPGKQDKFEIEEKERTITIEAGQLMSQDFNVKSVERKIYFSSKDFALSSVESNNKSKPTPSAILKEKEIVPSISSNQKIIKKDTLERKFEIQTKLKVENTVSKTEDNRKESKTIVSVNTKKVAYKISAINKTDLAVKKSTISQKSKLKPLKDNAMANVNTMHNLDSNIIQIAKRAKVNGSDLDSIKSIYQPIWANKKKEETYTFKSDK